jgi:hypothetical protein
MPKPADRWRRNVRHAARLAILPALAAAYYLGTAPGQIGDFVIIILGIVVLAGLLAALACASWWRRLLAALLFAGLGLHAWQLGADEHTRAFNECVHRGETVRQALADYRAAHGRYPAELAQAMPEDPCRPRFANSLLDYTASANTYTLYFGDALVSHRATESSEFDAHK